MFDIGWLELIVIGIVALIVVGPKDLPGMFRTVGRFMGKARGMAREFQRSMEQAADDAGLKEVSKSLHAAADPLKQVRTSTQSYASKIMNDREDKAKADAGAKAEPKPAPAADPAPGPAPAPKPAAETAAPAAAAEKPSENAGG